MTALLFFISIILAGVALSKAGEAIKEFQKLRKRLDTWDELISSLIQRVYRLEAHPEERGRAPAEMKPSPPSVFPAEQVEHEPQPQVVEKVHAAPMGKAEPPPCTPPHTKKEPERPLEKRPVFPRSKALTRQTVEKEPARPVAVAPTRDGWSKFEEVVGKRWMTWVGVFVLFLSAGFFLKYAFTEGWIGPGTQILIAVAGGISLLGLGHWFIKKDMRALGQGLIGGGLMILYAAFYAAYSPAVYGEPVIPHQKTVFGLMCLVTVAGVTLAIRNDAIAISFLAILGGFLTPVLVSTDTDARDTLFAYVLLLDLGVMGVALYRKWRALDALAFIGTITLFSAWFYDFYTPSGMVPTLLWLGVFFMVFLILPFVNHLRRKTDVTVERFLMALANATFAFGYAYRILYSAHDMTLGWIALGMAAAYLVMGVLTRKRTPEDGKSLFGFIALAVLFLTISVPLQFGMNGITLVWTGEASILLYLGYKYSYQPLRAGAFIILLLAVGRVISLHWPQAEHVRPFTPILNRQFMILLCAPVGAWIFAAIHQIWKSEARAEDRFLKLMSAIGAGLLGLIFLHVELEQWLLFNRRAGEIFIDPGYVRTLLWSLGAAGFLAGGLGGKSTPIKCAGVIPLLIAAAFGVSLYTNTIHHDYPLFLNGRFGSDLFLCALLFAYALAVRNRSARTLSLTAAGYASLLLMHVELYQWIWKIAPAEELHADYLSGWVLALLWSLGAGVYLFLGLRKESRGARLGGLLPLFTSAALCVLLYCMSAPQGYWIFLNARFIASAFAVVMAFAFSFAAQGHNAKAWAATATGLWTLTLFHVEIQGWMLLGSAQLGANTVYVTGCVLSILWLAGSLALLGGGVKGRSAIPRTAGLIALFLGFIYAVKLWGIGLAGYRPVLNARFIVGLTACSTLFVQMFFRERVGKSFDETERPIAKLLFWCTIASFLVLFSSEPYSWYTTTISDPERGRWLAQMSMTIVWGTYASALLVIGFWRQVRTLRITALCLFCLTAAKLALVDLATLRQIYRIISFFVLGLLMIGASYLYHRAEVRMRETSG